MTTGEKISKLRKENNYTQEQLAQLLGVSRQSVSKYESGLSYPETEKLIRLSELFDCTVDYLLKGSVERENRTDFTADTSKNNSEDSFEGFLKKLSSFERKSKRTVCGVPLWHISKNAKGIIAVGLKAKGIISIGLLSIGIMSLGIVSIGLLALGFLAIGIISAGSFAIGALACGAISLGIIAVGAIAIGEFSIGALSIGHYFAYGDHASAMFAFGKTKATGEIFEGFWKLSSAEKQTVIEKMNQEIPLVYHWIVKLFSNLI